MTISILQQHYRQAANLIRQADSLIITAGAGMGVDSGLPDFRGDHGFWAAYPALAKAQIKFTDIADPDAFVQDPHLAWGFYGHRLNLYRATTPHLGFQILLNWAQQMEHGAFVYTSNVDGQFQKAGFDESRIVECHGSIHHLQMLNPTVDDVESAEWFQPEIDEEHCRLLSSLPRDKVNNQIMRPNILMFNDWRWIEDRTVQQQKEFTNWRSKVRRPVIIELGAGSTIATIRNLSNRMANHSTRFHLIRINPVDSAVPKLKDIDIQTGALEGLTGINGYLLKDS